MEPTIEKSFVKQFEAEVHLAYQMQGSKLRPTVRTRGSVRGSTVVFQKVGRGVASTKSRHGAVPVMNLEHSDPVECGLEDWYAGEWVDRFDELKTNIEERQVVARSGAYALGRKTDDLIIAALNSGSGLFDKTISKVSADNVLSVFETLGAADVPDDGDRFALVGWKQWSQLLALDEFSSAEYVGEESLPWRSPQARRWLGTVWIPHSGLPKDGSLRRCFWYHRSAVGHAVGSEIRADVTWHGDRASWFVNSMMSQGACLIDPDGSARFSVSELPAPGGRGARRLPPPGPPPRRTASPHPNQGEEEMPYSADSLSVLAYANGFTLWHYDSPRETEATVAASSGQYFLPAADLLREGDLVLAHVRSGAATAIRFLRVDTVSPTLVRLKRDALGAARAEGARGPGAGRAQARPAPPGATNPKEQGGR